MGHGLVEAFGTIGQIFCREIDRKRHRKSPDIVCIKRLHIFQCDRLGCAQVIPLSAASGAHCNPRDRAAANTELRGLSLRCFCSRTTYLDSNKVWNWSCFARNSLRYAE
jgi:hypothetical protein